VDVKLLPRRNADEPDPTALPEIVDDEPTASVTESKGRPTPKRRDSAGVRGPVIAPKTRKEAYARQRQQSKAQRAARRTAGPASRSTAASTNRTTAAARREALRAGDPSALPRRDQGPTRKLARDWVDSHRMFSNYLLLLFPLMIASYLIPGVSLAVIVIFIALIAEWYVVGRRIRSLATQRFGSADGSAMSLGWYAGSRAYLPRRWRLPAPQVELGDAI
jgi:hypothetical protein